MMWPGAIYPYQGKNVTYRQEFDPEMDWNKRVDTVSNYILLTTHLPLFETENVYT